MKIFVVICYLLACISEAFVAKKCFERKQIGSGIFYSVISLMLAICLIINSL